MTISGDKRAGLSRPKTASHPRSVPRSSVRVHSPFEFDHGGHRVITTKPPPRTHRRRSPQADLKSVPVELPSNSRRTPGAPLPPIDASGRAVFGSSSSEEAMPRRDDDDPRRSSRSGSRGGGGGGGGRRSSGGDRDRGSGGSRSSGGGGGGRRSSGGDRDRGGGGSRGGGRRGGGGDRDRDRSSDEHSLTASESTAASGAIDPSKPEWYRKKAEDERQAAARTDRERRKRGLPSDSRASSSSSSDRGDAYDVHGRKIVRISQAASAGLPGAFDEGEADEKLREKLNGDVMDMGMEDERIGKGMTADEELHGRSIWSMVDRGTLAVGCCLILIVIVAVTIPVSLISEDDPYVAPIPPPAPTPAPSFARDQVVSEIGERLARITPGGMDALLDESTAHYRAWMWLVYEDGMELGPAKDHMHQRFVLMVIYFISGPWTPVEGRLEWGSPVHECEWEGIYCKDVEDLEDELEGRIEELLEVGREDGIKIDVPQRVANKLHLRQRLVSGEVPAEFSLLYYLQHLDLENNKLVGALPTPLYKLFNLQTLFLEQNELTNVEAIGEYRHLENLALSKNNFQGPLPESFANLKKLKTLYLHTNGFTGRVFDIIGSFKSLELLDIAHNRFDGTLPPELGSMKNLTEAYVGHNDFAGGIPKELVMCKNLKNFQCDGSHGLGGTIPSFLGQLPHLEFLKLDTCAFNGTLPMSLGNLQKLSFLDVNSNDLGGKIPTQLGKATSLKTLALANNDFEGGVPSEFGNLKKLEKLYLQNTDLSGTMPSQVCELRDRGDPNAENATEAKTVLLEVLWVPCDVECDEMCCTNCS
ncbi:hypothetical protein ACHAWF_010767 [Thalassiosira exigua]